MHLSFLFGGLLLLAIAPATAGPATQDHRRLAHRLAVEVIRPAQTAFAEKSRATARAWDEICRSPSPSRGRLADLHRDTARAWWFAEAVRYGPVAEDFRAERISFWPDRRNATTRGLARMLDPAAPEPTERDVRAASAAVQGLPALERLLFDAQAGGRRRLTPRECALGRAIAANVATLAAAIDTEWAGLTETVAVDEAAAREMVARVTTDVLGEFETLLDVKLAPVGKSPDTARPDGFEGRGSGTERDAVRLPLDGAAALVAVMVDGREGGETILATLETARSIAGSLPPELGGLLDTPQRRARLILLRDAIRAARDVALDELPALVGITVGFNSRDGD